MRIIAWTSSYWNSQAEFDCRYEGTPPPWLNDPRTGAHTYAFQAAYNGRFGLRRWHREVHRWFKPFHCFIACGTWSDPAFNRFGQMVRVVNAGVEPDRPCTSEWNYPMCAFTAAMAYVLDRRDWDLLIHLPDDVLVGAVNWPELIGEFQRRPEEVLSTRWYDRFDWFIAMKRAGAARLLHMRQQGNLNDRLQPGWQFPEDELSAIMRGKWWCPWPHIVTIRRDFGHASSPAIDDEDTLRWPFVRLPNPAYVERYEKEQSSQGVPLP